MSPWCRFYHIKMCTPRVSYRTKNYHGWFDLNFWHCLTVSGGFSDGSAGKKSTCNQETQENQVQSLGWEDPLGEEMAIHSSIFAWKIPCTEEPGGLHSPWGHRESYTTVWLSTQPSLALIHVYRRPEHSFGKNLLRAYYVLGIFLET